MLQRPTRRTFRICHLAALSLSLGPSVTIAQICPEATILRHHDGSFENGYSWTYDLAPPDYGAFAEGFDEVGQVCGMVFYLTQTNGMAVAVPDIYVWEAQDDNPGPVIAVLVGVHLGPIGFWPYVSPHQVEIEARVDGSFFAGLWPDFEDSPYWVGGDLDASAAWARTKVPPGQPWPSGWQDLDQVFGDSAGALGVEVHLVPDPTPVTQTTWGGIKRLFRSGR